MNASGYVDVVSRRSRVGRDQSKPCFRYDTDVVVDPEDQRDSSSASPPIPQSSGSLLFSPVARPLRSRRARIAGDRLMRRSTCIWLVALAGVPSSCISQAPSFGSGTAAGTFAGHTLSVVSAIDLAVPATDGPWPTVSAGSLAMVVLSDAVDLCATISGGHQPANSQFLFLAVMDLDASTETASAPTAAGTYAITPIAGQPPHQSASVTYGASDSSCAISHVAGAQGTDGTLTLTVALPGQFDGSATLTTVDGEEDSVTFSPAECPELSNLFATPALPCP
jgi:hypothetical protein